MAKRKVVNNRRVARDKRSGGGKASKYAQKIALQKQGKFSPNSPFRLVDGGGGLGLTELNNRRFGRAGG